MSNKECKIISHLFVARVRKITKLLQNNSLQNRKPTVRQSRNRDKQFSHLKDRADD